MVLGTKSLKSRCQWGWFLLRAVRDTRPVSLPLSGGLLVILSYNGITQVFIMPNFPFLYGDSHMGLRPTLLTSS